MRELRWDHRQQFFLSAIAEHTTFDELNIGKEVLTVIVHRLSNDFADHIPRNIIFEVSPYHRSIVSNRKKLFRFQSLLRFVGTTKHIKYKADGGLSN
jgi:hypothetical protein